MATLCMVDVRPKRLKDGGRTKQNSVMTVRVERRASRYWIYLPVLVKLGSMLAVFNAWCETHIVSRGQRKHQCGLRWGITCSVW